MQIDAVSPKQLNDFVRAGRSIELIDVRTPVEFREVHVPFARNVPLDQLDAARIKADRVGSPEPLYVICKSGSRGKQAREKLMASGCSNVVNVEGGTQAWDEAGLPVVRGKQAVSLERQVRIAAGSLVLLGVILSVVVHPPFV